MPVKGWGITEGGLAPSKPEESRAGAPRPLSGHQKMGRVRMAGWKAHF